MKYLKVLYVQVIIGIVAGIQVDQEISPAKWFGVGEGTDVGIE